MSSRRAGGSAGDVDAAEPDQLHRTVVVDGGVAEVERTVRQARRVEGAHVAPQPVEHHVGHLLGSQVDQGPARAVPLHEQGQLPVATDGDDGWHVHAGPLGEQRDEGLGVHPVETAATTLGRAPVPEAVPQAGQQLGVAGIAAQRLHVQRRPALVPTEHDDLAPGLACGEAGLMDRHAEVGRRGHDLGQRRPALGRAEGQVHRGGDAVAEHERGRDVDQQAGRDGEGGRRGQQGDDGQGPAQRSHDVGSGRGDEGGGHRHSDHRKRREVVAGEDRREIVAAAGVDDHGQEARRHERQRGRPGRDHAPAATAWPAALRRRGAGPPSSNRGAAPTPGPRPPRRAGRGRTRRRRPPTP